MEIKNKLSVTRGEREGDKGQRRARVKSGSMCGGPIDRDEGED